MMLPDVYNTKARIAPILAVVALPVLSICLFVEKSPDSSWLAPPIALVALWMLMSVLGRSRGKALEKGLFKKWGGSPTLQMLRYKSSTLPREQLIAIHSHFAKASNVRLPDAAAEAHDSGKADVSYDAITAYLRDATRDRKVFPLVFDELCNYGFVRNLFGLRPFGVALGIVMALAIGCWFTWIHPSNADIRVIAIAMNCLSSIIWLLWPTESTMRQVADSYAQKLINAGLQIIKLDQKPTAKSPLILP